MAKLPSRRNDLAVKIRDYVKKRAKVEGVEFKLSLEFFEQAVMFGANPIFGVVHDGKKMLRDEQEPRKGFFAENA